MGGKYLVGLTLPIERKNVENIAEQVAATPRKLQEFLSDSHGQIAVLTVLDASSHQPQRPRPA